MVSKRQRLAQARLRQANPDLFPTPQLAPKAERTKKKKRVQKKNQKRTGVSKHPLRAPGMRPDESCFICKSADHIAKNCPEKSHWEKNKIIMRLLDDTEVSDELWDEVIESMMQLVDDKVPAIRGFAVRALARFVNDGKNGDIINLFLRALSEERNSDVRKVIILSMPPSATTSTAIVGATLDVSESVRKASYTVLANKFPLQSLSIKLRTIILQRGLSDRSSSVTKECLNMLKDEWLAKCCSGDPIALLRYLDVETYELVGESVMQALLKEGLVKVQDGQSVRQYLASCERIGG